MTTIDLTPLYRSSIGFDRFGSLLDNALRREQAGAGYPPYNIQALDDSHYQITLAVAGFEESELQIEVEQGVLSVRGSKAGEEDKRNYLYRGIATRGFERKFNLADHVEVANARLRNGMLEIDLVHEVPEAMKPKRIPIQQERTAIETNRTEQAA